MNLKYLLILVAGLFIAHCCYSQKNISGIWEGRFLSFATDLGQPKLVVEIFNFDDSIFTGISHLYYQENKYEHYKIVGRYLKADSLVLFKEVSTIAVDLGIYANCLGTYLVKLSQRGDLDLLDGFWMSNIKGCTPDVTVWLRKKHIAEIKKTPAPVKAIPNKHPVTSNKLPVINPPKKIQTVAPPVAVVPLQRNDPVIKDLPAIMPAVIIQRETDVQSLLEISAADKDSIKVEVYDNAEIDGDSVSVYEEQVQRINKKRISTKPITFYVSLNKNTKPIVHLRLVAESLGSIPPCTALMIVTTKSKRYEVHLSSNFSKNATVELFLKE